MFRGSPRICRLILAVYEDDLRQSQFLPSGGYRLNLDCVIKRLTYQQTHGENGDLGVAGAPKLQRFSGRTPVNPNFEEDDVKLRLKGEDVQVGAMEEREEQDQICFQITVPCDSG
ncbi:unnamed protein product [Camellia sinensis]